MRRYSTTEIIKIMQEKEISLFTLTDFARLFRIDNQNTLYKKIQRLEEKGVIKRLIKGKYLFLLKKPNEFFLANFLYQPSYISLESALSFYGVITAFPYQISSVTLKKTKLYVIGESRYQYTQVSESLFWGWEKKENFLIAEKEKSLLDYLYLVFKGLRFLKLDKLTEEFDFSQINRRKFRSYFKMIKNPAFIKFLAKSKI